MYLPHLLGRKICILLLSVTVLVYALINTYSTLITVQQTLYMAFNVNNHAAFCFCTQFLRKNYLASALRYKHETN